MPNSKVILGLLTEITINGHRRDIVLISTKEKEKYILSGRLSFEEPIDWNDLIKDLEQFSGQFNRSNDFPETAELLNELKLRIKELSLRYEDGEGFSFVCSSELHVEDNKNLDIDVRLSKKDISLVLKLSQYQFDLKIKRNTTDQSIILIANYQNKGEIKLRNFVNYISTSGALLEEIPESLEFKISQALLVYEINKNAQKKSSKFFFSLGLDLKLSFTDIPLIGSEIPADQNFGLENLSFLFASAEFSDVTSLRQLLDEKSQLIPITQTRIDKGLYLSAVLKFFGEELFLPFQLSGRVATKEETKRRKNPQLQSQGEKALSPATTPTPLSTKAKPEAKPESKLSITKSDNTIWLSLNKSWKLLELKRVGVQYQEGSLFFLLDASISCASLKITCDGLGVGSSLKKFEPKFKLPGIGIEYKGTAPIEIGGAFLWKELKEEEKKQFKFKFAGLALVKTKAFTITVVGEYAQFVSGESSFLIYGVLDKTLGGSPFFLVTGLALAFGYNRHFKTPSLDEVKNFPLVRIAMQGSEAGAGGLISSLRDLDTYIPPAKGEIVLAVGVKFTSFKIIDSFILLVAKFGNTFELNFLGFSTLIAPPAEVSELIDPISKMELAIVGTFKPEEGILKVDGKILPGSYLFSTEGKVSGGFAFYAWFKGQHEGDFVLTIGGYHPRFNIPEHYPKVERLEFNWPQVKGSNLNLKGSVYFALTSSAIMAGGRLEATWDSANLKAFYIIELHLLIAWKPFYYDAQVSVNIGVSYTFSVVGIRKTIGIDVSASLHIWGPEFSGRARIKLSVVEFEISFGRGSAQPPSPLTWEKFKQSFLPTDDQICTISVSSGLIRQIGQGKSAVWVINPKEFALTTNTVIPAKKVEFLSEASISSEAKLGIASMDVKSDKFTTSTHKIEIERKGNQVQEQFKYEPIYKNVPVALWGESKQPNLNSSSLVKSISGLIIQPKEGAKPGIIQAIDCSKLAYTLEKVDQAYCWGKFTKFKNREDKNKEDKNIEAEIQKTINAPSTKSKREGILTALGFAKEEIRTINLSDLTKNKNIQQSFVMSPVLQEADSL